jgi:cell wall-associated NlpC family hydrolase
MQVYKKFGVSLPHWDDKQYRKGTQVPKGQEKPGDLVFFNEHGRSVSHVGIYAGNGKILHASDYYNKVVESQMKYIEGYVGARRVL